MPTKRSDKLVCSEHCQNQMSYVHRRDYPEFSKSEFKLLIKQWIKDGIHPNTKHPIAKLDSALAGFYEALANVIKNQEEIKQ